MKDFFISYNKADKDWATWIAWTLEAANHSVVIQAWDFRPGGNFVLEMQRALTGTEKTILVLSEDFLQSSFTAAEWSSVFVQDPEAKDHKLVPVRVKKCKPSGLLAPLVYVDLVGLSKDAAEAALLGAFEKRAKPVVAPSFPGDGPAPVSAPAPMRNVAFPGPKETGKYAAVMRSAVPVPAAEPGSVSAADRLQLGRTLAEIAPGLFNMLLFVLQPPAGLIPPMPAPQLERSTSLLSWAEGPYGAGLLVLKETLDAIVKPNPT